jgi:hypothetical protein
VYFFTNFGVFLVINITVEVIIVWRLRRETAEKRQRIVHMNVRTFAHVSFRTKRKLEMDSKKEQRAITMVVANSVIDFVLRSQQIIVFLNSLYSLFPQNVIFTFFNSAGFLPDCFTSLSYLSYILTFSTNVLIYILFNQKFKQAFSFWSHVESNK